MIIPHDQLSPDALEGVIEEYVTRDGTELSEASTKIEQVRAALRGGELVLVYDPEAESCNLLPPDAVPTDPESTSSSYSEDH